ncbi:MAG: Fic/DOC family N-terminal domain-containing protein [Burkholderiaceae bacterium]
MTDTFPLETLARLRAVDFETTAVLKKTATASRKLAELEGLAASITNQAILIKTLGLQEAKDSSAIGNIVITHHGLFRSATYPDVFASLAAKELTNYAQALRTG